jgi:hypothetical protein
MTAWVRFRHGGESRFGTLTPSGIAVYDGDMFGTAQPAGRLLAPGDVELLAPAVPSDMTLLPGDLIACGTSVGVGVMKEPVNTVTVAIDGIGELTNEFRQ